MKQDKKRLNYITIEPDTLSWLIRHANLKGMHIGSFAGYLLDEAASSWEPPGDDEEKRQHFWLSVEFTQEELMRKRTYHAATIYQSKPNPTEEDADRLASMCELAGLNYEDVMKEVSSDPFSSLIANSKNGSVLGECIRWLARVMKERERVPASVAKVMANSKGYSQSTLNRARASINSDLKTPSIESRKEGNRWVWHLIESNGNE